MSETSSIVTPTIKVLNDLGYRCWRTNSGRKGGLRGAPKGTPDIIGYTPDGRFLGLEAKLPGCGVSIDQAAWLGSAKKAGCLVGVIRSVREAVDLVLADSDSRKPLAA